MTFPKKIPIERIERYHTHYLGSTKEGNQFWGYTTFNYVKNYDEINKINGDYRDFRNEYAILHVFDKDGKHLNTKHCLVGNAKQIDDITLFRKLEELLTDLDIVKFNDIVVEPFETKIDNIIFGLIPNYEYGFIELQPNSTLAFGEPWDGSYST
jgi:formate hydrogenlyase regulatory protein HycA